MIDHPRADDPRAPPIEADRLLRLRGALRRSLAAIEDALRRAEPIDEGPHPLEFARNDVLAPVIDSLEESGSFRVLRRLAPDVVDASAAGPLPGTSVAVVVDVETTGLDHRRHEVIELGMLRFEHRDGAVTRVTGALGALQEPRGPISPEITRLTGLTPAMVAGHRIDPDAVADMLLGVDLVIAHHAAFDRPFCESLHPGFTPLPWACSVREIDWAGAGFEGAKLGHLLLQSGFFHRGHRALDDCGALLHLLRRGGMTGSAGDTLLGKLVASAAEPRRRVWADGAPFDRKELLKARGYRWHPGDEMTRKAWWREVQEADYPAEAEFLHREIYRLRVPLRTERVSARDRYRPL